jgi:hypothetical protein
MFKNIPQVEKAAAAVSGTQRSGDQRLNNEVSYEQGAEPVVTTTTHTLQDENTATAVMELDSQLNPIGFAKKSFEMTEMLERNQILTPQPITWSSTNNTGDVLYTGTYPSDLASSQFFKNKMENFYAIHADIEVTVKVNPTPFQQGSLIIIVHPKHITLPAIRAASYYPHELINMPMVNHAAVKIPFLSENEAYAKDDKLWSVSVVVATPLRTATLPDSLEVNVFGRFVSPELMIPVAQGNTEVLDQKKDGLVTKITGAVANVLETSGTALSMIPVIGEFIPPLTWTARAAHKVASYFGWSKAPNMEHAHLMVPIPGPRMCHGEGIDNGIPLSLSPDNTCNTANNSTDIDEMDFSYLFERKYIDQVLTMTAGENFLTIPLETKAVNTPTNILTMFRHRRWMRCFEFHMVKTKFHTGRLLIQYDYNNTIVDNYSARIAMSTVYSKIVDISQQDSFVFTIPWMDISPFDDHSLGRIVITTFNDVIAAETVAQDFNIIQYQSYRDVQLGQPLHLIPFAQGDCCGNSAPIPTDDLIPYEPKSMVEYTMGESVNSLRLLAKRFTKAGFLNPTGGPIIYRHDQLRGSLFGQINAMYLARAGSIRYKLHIPRNSTAVIELSDPVHYLGVPAYATQVYNGFMNNVVEFTIPFYYSKRRSFKEIPWYPFTIHLYDGDGIYMSTGSIDVYVAAGDDYNAMFPLGLDTESHYELQYTGVNYTGVALRDVGCIGIDVSTGKFYPARPTYAAGLGNNDQLIFPAVNAGIWYQSGFSQIGAVQMAGAGVVVPETNRTMIGGTPISTLLGTFKVPRTTLRHTTDGAPTFYSLCAQRGLLLADGTFASDDKFTIWANETYAVIFFQNEYWKFPIPAGEFIDYFREGTKWSGHLGFGAGSESFGDVVIPEDGDVQYSNGTYVATFTGNKQGMSILSSQRDMFVSIRSDTPTGMWSISRDPKDGIWYQNGYNPNLRTKWIYQGNVENQGYNFPGGAIDIHVNVD